VPPGCRFENQSEECLLLVRWLNQEQIGCAAGQRHQVDSALGWCRCTGSDLVNPAPKSRRLVLAFKRLSVLHLGADATFQPIVVEDIQFRPEPSVLFFQPLQFPVSGRAFVEIGFRDRLLEPL
jgi:hypothetical protein